MRLKNRAAAEALVREYYEEIFAYVLAQTRHRSDQGEILRLVPTGLMAAYILIMDTGAYFACDISSGERRGNGGKGAHIASFRLFRMTLVTRPFHRAIHL